MIVVGRPILFGAAGGRNEQRSRGETFEQMVLALGKLGGRITPVLHCLPRCS
jgi:hypothetical protein